MDDFVRDVRLGWRSLIRTPLFTLTAALTLSLGIGANTAIFSVVNAVLLRPLPYAEPDGLVSVWAEAGYPRGNYELLKGRARSYGALGGVGQPGPMTLTGAGEPARIEVMTATASLFPMLGVSAVVGRTFDEGEERPGADGVALLSWAVWQSRFGGDAAAVGRPVMLDGRPHTVIGVLPPDFGVLDFRAAVWVPSVLDPADLERHWAGRAFLYTIGRLAPGATATGATTELRALAPELRDAYPWDMPADFGSAATVVSLRDRVVGDAETLLVVLLGAVGLVLLVACANVANLALVRAVGRHRELAVRAALGAGRRRIAAQLLTESLVLAGLGGIGGLLIAAWGVPALAGLLPPGTPRVAEIRLDPGVLAFALGITAFTGLLFGLLPAVRGARTDLATALRSGRGDDHGRSSRRLSAALVIGEVAVAVVLVTGAGLVLRSFNALLAVDPGFQAERVVSASVAPPAFRYADAPARRAFYEALTARLEALPGVSAAATSTALPFGGRNYGSVFIIDGRPIPPGGDWPMADVRAVVSPSYLETMRVPLLDGRRFSAADRPGTDPVAILSERVAREHWPDGDAVGSRIRFPGLDGLFTIVGVVEDVKWGALAEDTRSALYLASTQFEPGAEARVVIRASGSTEAIVASLRDVVASLDDATPVADIRTLEQRIADSAAAPRFTTVLLGLFAVLALTLGAVGIYGVIAYAVGRRVREFGIRMALGARAHEVRSLVLGHGLRLGLAGIALGLAGAFAAGRALRSLLYGIGPADPVTFVTVPLILLFVALAAAWVPAHRATRVAPMRVLRD